MTNCDEIRMEAALYLSGEMEEGKREAFAGHLATCPACAAKVAEDRALDATLRRALGGEAPDAGNVQRAVRMKIAAEARRPWWPPVAAFAATAALLAVAVVAWRDGAKAPQWYSDAAADHRREVVEWQPRRCRTESTEVARLAGENGLRMAQVEGMAKAGYRLERAKVCRIGGQKMLHLVFSDGVRRYSIFVAPGVPSPEIQRPVRQGEEQVAEFAVGQFRGLAVSESSAEECAEMAGAAARQL